MAKGKTPKTVPKFSPYEIKLAELCANALWNGIDFRTDELSEVSDEVLLNNFYVSFQKLYKKPLQKSLIDEQQLRQLIRIAELKAMYRSKIPLNFKLGINAITKMVVPTYKLSTAKKPIIEPKDASLKVIRDLSLAWINNPNPSLNGNYRVPFSTRILFFCVPSMQIFNFSNKLAEKMLLPVRPQAAIVKFQDLMADGLVTNSKLLCQLSLPNRSVLNHSNWTAINKTDWWQRRVLDIALLLKFKVAKAHQVFVVEARKQTRVVKVVV